MSRKQKITAAGFFIILAVFLSLVAYTIVCLSTAARLMDSGDYMQAKSWYEKIHDVKKIRQCDDAYAEQRYQKAAGDMERGEYDDAKALLKELGDYRNSAELADKCDYLKAIALSNDGKYSEAVAVFETLGDYSDSTAWLEAARERLYQQATRLTYELELESARPLWAQLGDYRDSEELLRRCDRLLTLKADETRQKLLVPENLYSVEDDIVRYNCELGYVAVPKECNDDTRFFIYFPGGREIEISLDVFAYYSMAPAPNTIGVFLHNNGLSDMESKTAAALDMLEQVAMECGVFVHDLMVCGSSLGVYPTINSVVYCYEDHGISVDCALLLDAGNDWLELDLLPSLEGWAMAAEAGTDFYIFEGPGVGMNRLAIRTMVNSGNSATVVICYDDDHEQITLDAMGMGIMDWALGERTKDFDSIYYRFVPLYPGSTYPN